MNYYDKINWKNRSEGKTTKISAERLNHMDNQIFNNANAIGNVEKIADIGDGTLCGAAETLKETAEKLTQSLDSINSNLENKQDKLTNPLTKSDVVNNLTTATTNVPLSAKQGKVLKDSFDVLNHSQNTGSLSVGSALTFRGNSESNVVYGDYNSGIYFVTGNEIGLPMTSYQGFLFTLKVPNSNIIKVLFLYNGYSYIMSSQSDGTLIVAWSKFAPN